MRDTDGSCRFRHVKWGTWQLLDQDGQAEVIAELRRDGTPLDEVEPGYFDGWYCQGVAIDLKNRVFRAYSCPGDNHHRESLDLRFRTAPAWAGWDAGFAWGGREELAEVIPEASSVIVPYHGLEAPPLAELPFGERDQGFSTWDADRFELVVHRDVADAGWYDWYQECDLVTVITPDLHVLDYRFFTEFREWTDTLLPWLVHGHSYVDELRGQTPYPFPGEGERVRAGLVIDLDQRVLRYWPHGYVPSRLLAAVGAAWPGWELRRMRYGFAEHLAVTGRRAPDALATPPEVAAEWEAARRDLTPDPRPLRAPLVLEA
ncbi:hypothetical protein [Actinomadura spongiicola]|uniref:hypothetical protein n=1 Tax=Actinomadura spongiicola TaxID=2303421 RepID=UPI0011C18EF3|nr:hypothetical protein [Actinomadura spongiicola]